MTGRPLILYAHTRCRWVLVAAYVLGEMLGGARWPMRFACALCVTLRRTPAPVRVYL